MYNKTNLNAALSLATGVVPAKPLHHHILSCVCIQESTITACNLEQQWSIDVDERATDPFCVDAKRFLKIVKAAPTDHVLIKRSDDIINIESGPGHFKMDTWPAEDFPTITPETDVIREITIPANSVLSMLKPSYAMSRQGVRYYLIGICLHSIAGEGLYVVATDGARLAYNKVPGIKCTDTWQIILPAKAVQEIRKGLRYAPKDPVHMRIYKNAAEIRFGETATLTTKLVEGTFPDWKRVIPTDRHRVTMSRDALLETLKRCAISGEVGVLMTIGEGQVTLSVGDLHREDLEAMTPNDQVSIGFNTKLFVELISNVGAKQVTVDYLDGNTSIKVIDGDATHVLMPMRI